MYFLGARSFQNFIKFYNVYYLIILLLFYYYYFKLLLQEKEKSSVKVHVDDAIQFSLLSVVRGSELGVTENVFDLSLNQAVAGSSSNAMDSQNILSASKLNKVTQLTGFSDPVYAEAYVHVNQYDIVLDVLIINQTGEYAII